MQYIFLMIILISLISLQVCPQFFLIILIDVIIRKYLLKTTSLTTRPLQMSRAPPFGIVDLIKVADVHPVCFPRMSCSLIPTRDEQKTPIQAIMSLPAQGTMSSWKLRTGMFRPDYRSPGRWFWPEMQWPWGAVYPRATQRSRSPWSPPPTPAPRPA